ncbi:MAG TPA: nucleotidyltransferase domain-containing protein [Novosphingobium sp.]|nr:nucleotidyltransferase domain-containing protein [Novosphingobium sp.]
MTHPIPKAVRADIEQRLAAIEAGEGVHYLLAVESGSRAWGFPSPDSDYDVRFVYVRSRDWYLNLSAGRDVIETPIEDDIDLNGWDIRKLLTLMLKSNAVASEWLASPIRYRADHPMVARIAALADTVFDPRGIGHHYANLGQRAVDRRLEGDAAIPVKHYFYALRPALAIRALRLNPARRPAMNLQRLMEESDLSSSLSAIVNDLVEAKARTRELGNARRYPELDELIRKELGRADELPERKLGGEALAQANQIFLDLVNT